MAETTWVWLQFYIWLSQGRLQLHYFRFFHVLRSTEILTLGCSKQALELSYYSSNNLLSSRHSLYTIISRLCLSAIYVSIQPILNIKICPSTGRNGSKFKGRPKMVTVELLMELWNIQSTNLVNSLPWFKIQFKRRPS